MSPFLCPIEEEARIENVPFSLSKELIMSFINNRSYFLGPLKDTVQEQLAANVAAS